MQVKPRFTAITANVSVSWTVIIGVNGHTSPEKVEDRWPIIRNSIYFGEDFIIDEIRLSFPTCPHSVIISSPRESAAPRLPLKRTYAGLAAARARGRQGGRKPSLEAQQIKEIRALLRDPSIRTIDVAKRYPISRSTLYKHIGAILPTRK
jgi:hypothetical protein